MISNEKIFKSLKNLKKYVKNYNFLHKPLIEKKDLKFLTQSIKLSEVSTYGRFTNLFEKKIGKYLKSNNIVSTVNGTSALQSILSYLKVNSEHEVLVQSFTFVATVNPIIHLGAYPHFIDVSQKTLGADPEKLDNYLSSKKFKFKNGQLINNITKKIIKVIIITHSYGYSAEINKLVQVAKKYKLTLIEDAAETIGSQYRKKKLGTFGDFSILSFNGNKTITTGAGGLVITKKKKDLLKIKHIITTSKVIKNNKVIYDEPGFNYRMPSLNAALGLTQIEKLNKILKYKKKLFLFYKNHFKNFNDLKIFNNFDKNSVNNFWILLLILDTKKISKQKFLQNSRKLRIDLKEVWTPLHKMNYLKKFQKMNLDNSNIIHSKTLCLPSSPT
ncbi:DegT/DnrJ/EryC1/StrS family aminotransferase [Candidatus Pelagibacter sp.]|jgi:perosamine synthetase|nr:DegT/DnrJ/EryC1/StrS family aminotransferase [Candidatus Pelagibacter sp.]